MLPRYLKEYLRNPKSVTNQNSQRVYNARIRARTLQALKDLELIALNTDENIHDAVFSEETNTVYVNVVNRHQDKTIKADILSTSGKFTGEAESSLVNVESIDEPFSFDKQDDYKPVTKEIKVNGNKLTCSFPAHSFTQIKVKVKK